MRDFAERVLFSSTLEEKLAPPPTGRELDDDRRGAALEGSPLPGRPADLNWPRRNAGIQRNRLPARPDLVDDERRGELLHFFANHELLATELMALVLLKFPDAPAGFRRDVLATLLEEQNHTKWYLGRMRQCGVRFGELPVSGYFWNSVAPMASPLDYVTRLSLTFEQANLDYSRHYAGLMRDAGDERTAAILERIYRDEISHVGTGLRWFRRWKSDGQSDWDAFRERLVFPLSPRRARANGAAFNEDGRLEAGLDADFVRSLAQFERSTGRTPNVFWFCPDAERQMAAEVAGSSYTPNRAARELTRDLDLLPAFLARPDDVVLVGREPSLEHRERLRRCGLALPEFEVIEDGDHLPVDSLVANRKLHELRPWAWCPSSAQLAERLGKRASVATISWHDEVRSLFSKSVWAQQLGEPGVTIAEAGQLDGAISALGSDEVVLKAPFAASGAGLRRWSPGDERLAAWIDRVLADQGSLRIEPWCRRVFDFSVQYEVTDSGMRHLGAVHLHNRDSGAFVACSAGPKFCSNLDPELARFLVADALPLYEADGELAAAIHTRCRAAGYRGPLGVDAFVYREDDGKLSLRRVCEINPRFTMGRLTWELSKRVAPGRRVRFAIERGGIDPAACPAPDVDHHGRLRSGSVILTEGDAWQARLTIET